MKTATKLLFSLVVDSRLRVLFKIKVDFSFFRKMLICSWLSVCVFVVVYMGGIKIPFFSGKSMLLL